MLGLRHGDKLAIELVEAYTKESSYLYQSIEVLASSPLRTLDQYPRCGASFDFQPGDTLHVTALTEDLGQDEGSSECWPSSIAIDSPDRRSLTSSVPPPSFAASPTAYPPLDGRLSSSEHIALDGCPGVRTFNLATPGGAAFPDMSEQPRPNALPPFVLVRAAYRVESNSGDCAVSKFAPDTCTDQFVVRVRRE